MGEREKGSKHSKGRLSTLSDRHISPAGGGRANDELSSQIHASQTILTMNPEESMPALKEAFKSVSGQICLCLSQQQGRNYFGHFEMATRMNSSVKQIEKRIEERVGLTLMRDCLLRLQASLEFTSDLENAMDNYLSYYKDLKEKGSELERDFSFKGNRFHDICLTAKDHLTFWSLFTERYSSETTVKYISPRLQSDIKWAHTALLRVISRFTTLISNILVYVLDIACFQQWQLADGLLRDISSAIEDLNRLLEYSRSVLNENDVVFKLSSASSFSDSTVCKLSGFCGKARQIPSIDVYSVSLSKLFQGTAKKRSRVLGGHVLSFVHQRQEISGNLKSDLVQKLEWRDLNTVNSDHKKLEQGNGVITVRGQNHIPQLKLDPNSPLVSFESIEYQFITELISKLATSNSLMSSHGIDKKLHMHKSLPQKGLYHTDNEDTQDQVGEGTVPTTNTEPEAGHSILKHSAGSVSPRLSKRVQWHHSIDMDSKAQVSVLYMDILWSSCSVVMCEMVEVLGWERNFKGLQGPLPLWSDSITVSVVRSLESLQLSESLPPDGSKALQLVSRYIHCIGAMSSWDQGFCDLLSIAQKDKCTCSDKPEDCCPSTKTVTAIINLLNPVMSIFEAAQKWTTHHTGSTDNCTIYLLKDLTSSLLPFLGFMQAILSFTLCWLDTKVYHFLSGWTLSPFFVLLHWDLPILVGVLSMTINKIKPLCVGQGGNYSWGLLPVQLEELQDILRKIKGLITKYTQLFEDDLRKMSSEFFQEAMPVGKVWKKSRQSGIPCQPNSYVEHGITQILEPVINGSSLLPMDSQRKLLALTTTIMMEAWSAYILKEEIVFSFYGAQQMQLDFNYVKCWISSDASGLSTEMQSHLLGLETFHHLDGATRLLMLQPRKKKQMDELDVELESNISAVSSSSVLSSFSGVDIDGYEIDVLNDKTIPNKQHWLDLRLRGGKSKKGLMPFCLKVQETK